MPPLPSRALAAPRRRERVKCPKRFGAHLRYPLSAVWSMCLNRKSNSSKNRCPPRAQAFTDGRTAAIHAALDMVSGGANSLTGGVLGWIVDWVMGQVLTAAGVSPEAKALTVACRVEYLKRSNDKQKAWNLTNKCSKCHCIGHNKRVRRRARGAPVPEVTWHLLFCGLLGRYIYSRPLLSLLGVARRPTRGAAATQNHPDSMDTFLSSKRLIGYVEDGGRMVVSHLDKDDA